jgi:hypothetical protein
MSRPFAQLTCSDLRSLAAAAEAGRLARPFSPVALGRLLDPVVAGTTAAALERLGLDGKALAAVLGLVADEREASAREPGRAELVWTGPELPGSASRDTLVVVRELFSAAESAVLVSGFAVYQGKGVFESLARRMSALPLLKVRLFLNIARPQGNRDSELALVRDFVSRFQQRDWPGEVLPEIYYDPRALADDHRSRAALHAKCIVVDDRLAFVTSANLTTAAQEKNIEAGILVADASLALSLRTQFETLVGAGVLKLACRPEDA